MTDQSGFAPYRGRKRQRSGSCSVCGNPSAGRVVVTLQERKVNPAKTKGEANPFSYPSIDSTSATFCEQHAIEVYEAAKKAVKE